MIKFADTGEKITYLDGGAPTVEDAERMAAASGRVVEIADQEKPLYNLKNIVTQIYDGLNEAEQQ